MLGFISVVLSTTVRHYQRNYISSGHSLRRIVNRLKPCKCTVNCTVFTDGLFDHQIHTSSDGHLASVVKNKMENLKPPDAVRGMKVLDKEAFKRNVRVPSLRIPVKKMQTITKVLKPYLLKMRGLSNLTEFEDAEPSKTDHKLVHLNPGCIHGYDSLPPSVLEDLKSCRISSDDLTFSEIALTYENWRHHDIFEAVLPSDAEGVAGFTSVGHIVHLNLKEHLLDYKNLIGEVLLDKVSTARTVVNKVATIDNTFRFFQMEVLAGDEDFITTAKENGLSFKMDFSKVYWNSRLGVEHARVVSQVEHADIVYDVFAGIGPFAVPAGKKGCRVLANDLNPESHKWLVHNLQQNKVKSDCETFCQDGRKFINDTVKSDLMKLWRGCIPTHASNSKTHIIMNLPAMAVEFLDSFVGMLVDVDLDELRSSHDIKLPRVYCYSFSKAENPAEDVRERIETTIGHKLPEDHSIRFVRNVAPGKDMLCATFDLTEDVLRSSATLDTKATVNTTGSAGNSSRHCDDAEPQEKKLKVDNSS